MKHLKNLAMTIVGLWCCMAASAYDFQEGGFSYNILSETDLTVEVAKGLDKSDVSIPSTVAYNGQTYSVTSIGSRAFGEFKNLTSIIIPESVTSIGNHAFTSCTGLTSITIPGSVTSIGDKTFYNCTGLTSITIPEGVASISSSAFYNCSSLTSVTILGSVTSIRDNTFYKCSSLTSVTIPEGVTSIGNGAFNGCSALKEITCKAITPPTCGKNVFKNVDKTIPLYVPKGSVIKYEEVDVWRDFAIIREIAQGSSSINSVSDSKIRVWASDGSVIVEGAEFGKTINVYTIDGIMTASVNADSDRVVIPLQSGDVYIVKIGEQTLKVAL